MPPIMSFRFRSHEKEFLDNDNIETKDLYRNLVELDIINNRLGGYNASQKGLADILKTKKTIRTILDVGFGGGDFIKQLSLFAEKNNSRLFFYGIDLKRDCIVYAENNLAELNDKKLICDDYRNISAEQLDRIDVVHCSLFLHHLTDKEIIVLFEHARLNRCIILANDLHRNWFAWFSILVLTRLFSKSHLVKNDAPISVKRGFKRNELISFLEKAGFSDYSVKWSWAFRFIITAYE